MDLCSFVWDAEASRLFLCTEPTANLHANQVSRLRKEVEEVGRRWNDQ